MGFGLKFEGGNGQLIFDTEGFPSAETLTIQDGHPASLTNGSSINVPSGALLFGRVTSGNLYGVKNFSSNTFTNYSGQTISYFYAIPSNSAGNITGSGTYGLEIYGTNGTTVTFSTRRVANSSLNFIKVFDHNALANSESFGLSSTSGVYVSMDYMFYSSNSQITTIVNGFQWTSSDITYKGTILTTGEGGDETDVSSKGTIAVVQLRTTT